MKSNVHFIKVLFVVTVFSMYGCAEAGNPGDGIGEAPGPLTEQVAKLTASDGGDDDNFGWSVAISGDYAIVGSRNDDDNGPGAGAAYIFEREDGSWNQKAKLIASDGEGGDDFGVLVSISGNYALIGARFDNNGNGTDAGAAYVFERDGSGNWGVQNGSVYNETAKLIASDGETDDWFGESVAVSGEYAVIGAHLNNAGAAYVFERDGSGSWGVQNGSVYNETAILTASDGSGDDFFGNSVDVSGEYAVIGAYKGLINDSGSAYVFERDGSGNWGVQNDSVYNETAKLIASDGVNRDDFGFSVAISGDYAVIGAYNDDDKGSDAGTACIFERDGSGSWGVWNNTEGAYNETEKLTASDGGDNDHFGRSVSISGNYAVIGAHAGDGSVEASGSAYVFERGDGKWPEKVKLTASDGEGLDFFGISVSISGNYAVIGAYNDDDMGTDAGAAYIFE